MSDAHAPAEPAAGALSTGRERLLLAVLAAVQFVAIVDFMIVMPLGPRYLAEMGLDAERFARMVAARVSGLIPGLIWG